MLRLSRNGLPVSSVSSNASSTLFRSIRSAKLIRRFFRAAGAMRDQRPDSNAARPARTAASTSFASHEATRVSGFPVAGSIVSNVAPERALTYLPSTNAWPRYSSAAE
jgi:hypothetical protein